VVVRVVAVSVRVVAVIVRAVRVIVVIVRAVRVIVVRVRPFPVPVPVPRRLVRLEVPMCMPRLVRVPRLVRMPMPVIERLARIVRMRMRVPALPHLRPRIHLHVDRRDPAAHDPRRGQPLPPRADRIERRSDHRDRHAEIDERAQRHVTGAPAHAIEVQVLPAQRVTAPITRAAHRVTARAIRAAATAAPNPLSMFTVTTPGAQLVSIDASATSPPAPTP